MKCPAVAARSVHLGLVERIGAGAIRSGSSSGRTPASSARSPWISSNWCSPRRFRARETVSQFEAVGLDAIPIVALVTFLIGVVFAYLLGQQALRYGANIFVVDGVGIVMCRELSPLAPLLSPGARGRVHRADRNDEGAGGDRRDRHARPIADPGSRDPAARRHRSRAAVPRLHRRCLRYRGRMP